MSLMYINSGVFPVKVSFPLVPVIIGIVLGILLLTIITLVVLACCCKMRGRCREAYDSDSTDSSSISSASNYSTFHRPRTRRWFAIPSYAYTFQQPVANPYRQTPVVPVVRTPVPTYRVPTPAPTLTPAPMPASGGTGSC